MPFQITINDLLMFVWCEKKKKKTEHVGLCSQSGCIFTKKMDREKVKKK